MNVMWGHHMHKHNIKICHIVMMMCSCTVVSIGGELFA
jgi:hypothetical protein